MKHVKNIKSKNMKNDSLNFRNFDSNLEVKIPHA